MKMKIKYIATCAAVLTLASCNDYLKEDSKDLLTPETLNDYAPLLLGQGYPKVFSSQGSFINLMTDDVEMGPLYYAPEQKADSYCTDWVTGIDNSAGYGQYPYSWNDYTNLITDGFWAGRYANILGCNIIIEALPTMSRTEAQEGMYRRLAYQAHALRAYSYFCLINTYAKPYATANLNEPGVVLKTTANVEPGGHPRATIGEIYDLINNDIKAAETYIDGATTTGKKYELQPEAVYLLASRIALFQNDWDGVLAAGQKCMELNKSLFDLNSVTDSLNFGFKKNKNYGTDAYSANMISSDEVIFSFGRSESDFRDVNKCLAPYNPTSHYCEYGFHTSWTGAGSLIQQYDSTDLRTIAYFERAYYKTGSKRNPTYYAGQYFPLKFTEDATGCTGEAWRTSEVYLNMAEAYAQKASGVSAEAIDLLNQLREKRYATGSADAAKNARDFATKGDLIRFIWQERRRELCFQELMRFWDLRRQGMPSLSHEVYSSATEHHTYVLPAGSPNYVIQIPNSEVNYNNDIVQNEHVVISPSN